MNYELEETNYEDMDDLALPDHIDWDQDQSVDFSLDAMENVYGY